MTFQRPRLRTSALALATASVMMLTAVPSAHAVVPDQIRYQGASIYRATLPDRPVALEVWSSTPADSIDLFLNSVLVATDTTVEAAVDGYWVATGTVDLTGLVGTQQLTMRVNLVGAVSRSVPKSFTVIKVPVVVPVPGHVRPSAANTGVPAGVVTTLSGPLVITTPGTVIDSLNVEGCVVVAASNVTIRRTRIHCTQSPYQRAVVMSGVQTGLVLEDVEIDGGGLTDIGVDTSRTVIRRANIHDVNDGVRMGNSITIEDSWIHSMTRMGTLHPDAIQGISAQDIIIRGNALDPRNSVTGDFANSAIQLGSETGTMLSRNVLIENNYVTGGNCTINISGTINAENVQVRNNRFGTESRYNCPVLTSVSVPMGEANVMDVSGYPIQVQYAR